MFHYISAELCSPRNAASQVEKVRDAIESLSMFSLRSRLLDAEPWRSRGLRMFVVGNYLVFYLVDETSATVSVARVMYGGIDVASRLRG